MNNLFESGYFTNQTTEVNSKTNRPPRGGGGSGSTLGTLHRQRTVDFPLRPNQMHKALATNGGAAAAAETNLATVGESLPHNHFLARYEDLFVRMSPWAESVSFAGGEYLYQPGDEIEYVYFPETAVMSEFQILEDGRTIEIVMTGREGIVGLLSIFNAQPAQNWTQVSIAGTAYKINRQALREAISTDLAWQTSLFGCVNQYIGQISQRLVCNSYHTVEQRFCGWLLMLQDRHKTERLPLTQEQIARFLGVHRPSITHIAQLLRARKAINYVRGKIIIRNRRELQKSACVCHAEIDKNFGETIQ